jgi:hypothetical protein
MGERGGRGLRRNAWGKKNKKSVTKKRKLNEKNKKGESLMIVG